MQNAGCDQRTIDALAGFGQEQRDLGEVVGVRLARRPLAALLGVPPGGKIGCSHDQKNVTAHRIGSCTVTSLVPSGNVASTWMSWIISGMPSIT